MTLQMQTYQQTIALPVTFSNNYWQCTIYSNYKQLTLESTTVDIRLETGSHTVSTFVTQGSLSCIADFIAVGF